MILVDTRAGSNTAIRTSKRTGHTTRHEGLIDYPPLNDPNVATLHELDAGDVCLVGNGPDGSLLVGIELKSVSDLISSTNTGRLQATQVPKMLEQYAVCWLLVYGDYRANKKGDLELLKRGKWGRFEMGSRCVSWVGFERFLCTLSAVGVQHKVVRDMAEAAQWIAALAGWWEKPWHTHRSLHTFDRSRDLALMPGISDSVKCRARIAASLGVGYQRAVAAARHFATVREMVDAPESEWLKINGIGKGLAATVRRAIG